MDAQRNAALVRRAVEDIWQHGDLAVADVLFAPTYVNHGGLIPDLVCGPEAIKISVALYRAAFPAWHLAIESVVAEGETVALRWRARSTATEGRRVPAGVGGQGTLPGTTLCRLVADQIVESWTTWNQEAVLQGLGIVPSPDGV